MPPLHQPHSPPLLSPLANDRDIGIPQDQLIIDIAQVSLGVCYARDNLRVAVCLG